MGCEQRDGAGLHRFVGEAAREPGRAHFLLDRESVAGLQLEGGRAVGEHLVEQRARELEHLVVARLGEHARRPEDAAVASVQLPIGDAAQARFELVGPPPDERQVGVAVDEAGHEASAIGAAERRFPREPVGRTDVGDRAVVVPRDADAAVDPSAAGRPSDGRRRAVAIVAAVAAPALMVGSVVWRRPINAAIAPSRTSVRRAARLLRAARPRVCEL